MTHPSFLQARGKTPIGVALVLLGATTMLGWLLHVPAMVEIVEGLVPMVFNTGLGFALAGIALLVRGRYGKYVRAVLGAAMIVLYSLTLLEHLLDASFGIDMAWTHLWLDYGNTRHGRMAPNTAFGFILIGAINLRLARIESRAAAFSVVLLTFLLLAVGLTGLVGYLLAPDLLFGWARSARMAVHTAAGMILAAIGIWIGWSNSSWFSSTRFFSEAAKVRFLGTAILLVVTITVGLAGFVLMQQSLKNAIESRLTTVARSRGPWLLTSAYEIARQARAQVRLSGADDSAASLLAGSADGARRFDEVAQRLLAEGYRQVAVEDGVGHVLRAAGRNTRQPPFSASLDAGATELVWDGELLLRTRLALERDGRLLGQVRLDRSMRPFERTLFNLAGMQATELMVCAPRAGRLVCLPGANGAAAPPLSLEVDKHTAPMQHAVNGGAGIAYTLDARQRSIVAAYAPIVQGFGFVAIQDAAATYASVRHALQFGIPVILAISVLGALGLYSQTDPLVSRMHATERALERMAQYDALTGLANRRLFLERLQLAMQRAERHGYAVAVMFIDLDGFKQINDTLGHHAGDALLVEAARRMVAAVRATDTVARLGGDEFTVILEDATPPPDHAAAVANKILAALRLPFMLADGPAHIGASIGLLVPEGAMRTDIDAILREADARMYAAKQAGKNRVFAA